MFVLVLEFKTRKLVNDNKYNKCVKK